MTKKELMMKAIEELPEDAEIDDGIDRLLYLAGIERGLADLEAGRTVTHEELLKRIRSWQK
jgi:predicted transcriptional regulator